MRVGDARETLANIAEPIDILFLDGWKNLYLPILTLLLPQLPPGSIMLADNMKRFKRELAPFREFVRNPAQDASSHRPCRSATAWNSASGSTGDAASRCDGRLGVGGCTASISKIPSVR